MNEEPESKNNVSALMTRVRHGYERSATGLESVISFLDRRYTPLGRFAPGPFEGWGFLWQPAILGFLAMCAILAGSSFSDAPFKLNMAHTWFFGVPTRTGYAPSPDNETTLLFSIVLVYGGLLLLMRVWLRLAEVMRNHPGAPLKMIWRTFILWCVPMLIAPPLFSRDVFSYAAQGEMTSHHINPYILGPFDAMTGPYFAPVDPLWGHTPAPYGPFFLFLDGSIAKLTGHNAMATVVVLRLLEFFAVLLLGWGLTKLASALGRDPSEALLLGALNPLVLLSLIGGAHNDALMAALLVVGLSFAVRKKPMWGIFFCACATAVKAPAALGILYIAWTWLGPYVQLRKKFLPFAKATIVTVVTLGVFTLLAGFGLGWVKNLATPGTVRSWAAPATGLGEVISALSHSLGISVSTTSVISATRAIGFLISVGSAIWLLINADRRGWLRSLAISLVLFVVFGPVVQPWYLCWGLVLLAAVYVGREHFWLLALSITAPFLGLPGARQLLNGLIHANPFAMIASLAILGVMLLVPMGKWTQWSWKQTHGDAEILATSQ